MIITPLLPELILLFSGVFILFANFSKSKNRSKTVLATFLLGSFVAITHCVLTLGSESRMLFNNALIVDSISQYTKILIGVFSCIIGIMVWLSQEIEDSAISENLALLNWGALILFILSSADNFLLIYLGLQILSVLTALLSGVSDKNGSAIEASLKGFIQLGFSNLMFILGILLIFGFTKSFSIPDIQKIFIEQSIGIKKLWTVFGLLFVGLSAGTMVFPFHFSRLDSMSGASLTGSAFISASSLVCSITLFVRIFFQIFAQKTDGFWVFATIPISSFFLVIAGITLVVSSLMAYQQKDLKRMIAFSTMSIIGWNVMGIGLASHLSIASSLFGLAAEGVSLLSFLLVIQVALSGSLEAKVEGLVGLIWRRPFLGGLLIIFLLSFLGFPPFSGFVSRFHLVGAAINQKVYWLAGLAVFNWLMGFCVATSILSQIFKNDNTVRVRENTSGIGMIGAMVSAVPTLGLGLYWERLMLFLMSAIQAVKW